MKYEEVISQLCDVMKESENNAHDIYHKLEEALGMSIDSKVSTILHEALSLIQKEDIYRQKVERVINAIGELESIDISHLNISSTAKYIDENDSSEAMSQDDIEALMASMQK